MVSYKECVVAASGARELGAWGAWGGDMDRWGRADREAMARALTRAEDSLELRAGPRAVVARAALRVVRRRLEDELA